MEPNQNPQPTEPSPAPQQPVYGVPSAQQPVSQSSPASMPINNPTVPVESIYPETSQSALNTTVPQQISDKEQRINRETYLASVVINNIVAPVAFYMLFFLVVIGSAVSHAGDKGGLTGLIVILVLALYWLLTFFRAAVYRAYDIGMSQFSVLLLFVPVVNLIYMLYLCFKPGQLVPNEHGNVPLGIQLKKTLLFFG